MNDSECQEIIHGHVVQALHDVNTIEAGDVVTGWVLCYETLDPDGNAGASRIYGPAGMTTWRAHGLVDYLGAHDGMFDGSVPTDMDESDE